MADIADLPPSANLTGEERTALLNFALNATGATERLFKRLEALELLCRATVNAVAAVADEATVTSYEQSASLVPAELAEAVEVMKQALKALG